MFFVFDDVHPHVFYTDILHILDIFCCQWFDQTFLKTNGACSQTPNNVFRQMGGDGTFWPTGALGAGLGKSRQVSGDGNSWPTGVLGAGVGHAYWELGQASLGKSAVTGNPGLQGQFYKRQVRIPLQSRFLCLGRKTCQHISERRANFIWISSFKYFVTSGKIEHPRCLYDKKYGQSSTDNLVENRPIIFGNQEDSLSVNKTESCSVLDQQI